MAEVPEIVQELVERFDANIKRYKSSEYKEEDLKHEFINPLFEALGWDVTNRKGRAPQYRDVVFEDSIRTSKGVEAPDYCFTLAGRKMFFVEAKKPSVNIKTGVHPAYQLRRYAWSAGLSISILTDFEEFAVYESRKRPKKDDKASTERIKYFTYKDYEENWEWISSIFSRESVYNGYFDTFTEGTKKKRGTQEVDSAFLEEMEEWRVSLAKNIALRNPLIGARMLNHAVQLTIDRLIFLRMCEDRGIEPYSQLQKISKGTDLYQKLGLLFKKADEKYNSGLFHFKKERDRDTLPDDFTLGLTIDDNVLKRILTNLYYPDCPYEFSVLPPEILGNVYEQFLGKVIRLTAGHRAKVEDKPEVKKAGGVYYTPKYIVDYIVKNTVGKLCEGKSPEQITKLRILDPACGSGSFLLGAFSYLIDYHRDYYIEQREKKTKKVKRDIEKKIYQGKGGVWQLDIKEKKKILLNNIYGVDIDDQAVEVTKLSLLLKVLEGESRQMTITTERALPDLGNNIKCGNSLIGTDFYTGGMQTSIDDHERLKINAFDWDVEFKVIMKDGGFDAVIGNPPYGFHQIHSDSIKPYFKEKYLASKGSFEHYFLFYEASLRLVRKNGLHGYIVPVTWLTIPSAKSLREYILKNYSINEICWLPELVFKNAQVNTLISIIGNHPSRNVIINIYETLGFNHPPIKKRKINQDFFVKLDNYIAIFDDPADLKIIEKMQICSTVLMNSAKPRSGYNPYEVGKGQSPRGGLQTKWDVENKPYHSSEKHDEKWKPEIIGRNLKRYSIEKQRNRWIKYGPWLAAQRDNNNFLGKRILVQEITGGKQKRIIAAFCDEELYHSRDVIPILFDESELSPFFALGIINSKLMTWYHHKRNPKAKKGLFPKVLVKDLKNIPICDIEDSDAIEVLEVKVKIMINLVEKISTNISHPHEKQTIQRQIDALDKQIDDLVYKLYGLTDEEIRIVEETLA